jgi:hypothetical protein
LAPPTFGDVVFFGVGLTPPNFGDMVRSSRGAAARRVHRDDAGISAVNDDLTLYLSAKKRYNIG